MATLWTLEKGFTMLQSTINHVFSFSASESWYFFAKMGNCWVLKFNNALNHIIGKMYAFSELKQPANDILI